MPVLSPSPHRNGKLISATEPVRAATPGSQGDAVPRWARAARRMVLSRMAGIRGGGVEIVDSDGAHRVGDDRGPTFQLQVTDPRFYALVAWRGSLGAGDAYVHGYWCSERLVELLRLFARNLATLGQVERPWTRLVQSSQAGLAALLPRTRRASRRHIAAHYDLSNDLFATFLDPTMTYSCGLFASDDATLEQASLAKYERIARLLQLAPGDRVVEIGCGWGGFAEFAASRFGCQVVGVTISREQHSYACRRIAAAGLADRVEIRLCDYRDLDGRYDKLASIEMIEAIGHAQLPTFFGKCCSLLERDGVMALQAITIPDQRYARYRRSVDFIKKYIFPGGHLPSLGAMYAAAARATDFRVVRQEDFAEHYGRTLLAWRRAFSAAGERHTALGFGDDFRRAWDYYFASCAAGFLERQIGVSQIMLARPDYRGDR